MHKNQTVADIVEEVLARQASTRAERTGESFEDPLEAGRQLEELGDGPYRHERAEGWQEGLARERIEKRAEAGMPLSGGVSEPPAE
jgi:hypothetical protein